MHSIHNPMVDMYQTQLEASRQLVDAVFSGTGKIDQVFIEAAHRAVDEPLRFAQSMATSTDAHAASTSQADMYRRAEGTMNYQQEVVRILAEMQNEIGRSTQQYFDQIGGYLSDRSFMPFQPAPGRSPGGVLNPIEGIFSMWESAFQEIASMTNTSMNAGRSAFERTAATARRTTKEAADDITAVVDDAAKFDKENYGRSPSLNSPNRSSSGQNR